MGSISIALIGCERKKETRRVLLRLKSSTRKGLEFGASLENFGGNGSKSNGVKRRDSVWAITTAKMRGECPKRPGEHGSKPALLYIVRVVIWILAYSLHMEWGCETGAQLTLSEKSSISFMPLKGVWKRFDEKDVDGLHGPVMDSRCLTRW
ncbi:hypothetical protein Tco_0746238 [Tanacetum coccineum]